MTDRDMDLLWLMAEIRDKFAGDGYHLYGISMVIESALYHLEYVPEKLLHDMLYPAFLYLPMVRIYCFISGCGLQHIAITSRTLCVHNQ